MSKIKLSEFAAEMYEYAKARMPEEVLKTVEIHDSSTGDEYYENFLQGYTVDGKLHPVYFCGFFDAFDHCDCQNWFCIAHMNVDCIYKGEQMLLEYSDIAITKWNEEQLGLGHKEKMGVLLDEAGPCLKTFTDALEFIEYGGFGPILRLYSANAQYLGNEIDENEAYKRYADVYCEINGLSVDMFSLETDELFKKTLDDCYAEIEAMYKNRGWI